jgi:hypothetical protein
VTTGDEVGVTPGRVVGAAVGDAEAVGVALDVPDDE